jgi:translation initiation factor IF-3
LAYDLGLDLVEINSFNNPPICKLLDYGKYLYELEKEERKQRSKGKGPQLKEIKLSFKIKEHDFLTKVNRAKEILSEGDKVKVFLVLMGREMLFQDKARKMIVRFVESVDGQWEQPTERMGNRFFATVHKKQSKG